MVSEAAGLGTVEILKGVSYKLAIGLSFGIFFKADKRQAKNYRWGN